MQRRTFLLGGAAAMTAVPTTTWAECISQTTLDQCGPISARAFNGGNVHRPPDCIIDFRLPDEIHQSIKLNDGSFKWVLRLMTFNAQGQVSWTIAKTIENTPVRRQSIYFGTIAAVYVTCDAFTGWLSTGAIRSCGNPSFQRVDWNLDYRALDELERHQGS